MTTRSGLIFFAVSVGAGLFNYLFQVVAGRNLSAQNFANLNAWLANLSILFALGGLAQFVANFRPAALSQLRLSIVVFNFAAFLAIWYWIHTPGDLTWDRGFILVILSTMFGWLSGQAQIRLAFFVLSVAGLIVAVTKFGLAVALVGSGTDLQKYVFSLAAALFCGVWFLSFYLWTAADIDSPRTSPSWMAPILLSLATAIFPQFDLILMSHTQTAEDFSDFARASLFFRAVYFLIFIGAQWLLPRQIQGQVRSLSSSLPRIAGLTLAASAVLTFLAPYVSTAILNWERSPASLLIFLSSVQVSAMALLLLQVQELCARGQTRPALFVFATLAVESLVQAVFQFKMETYLLLAIGMHSLLLSGFWSLMRENSGPRWGFFERIRFIFVYFAAKVSVPFHVHSPRWTFFWFELRYSLINLVNSIRANTFSQAIYSGPDRLVTANGVFKIRPGSQDAAIASPAFEKADIERLFQIMDDELASGVSVDFIDVGANIGTFCVQVANRYRSQNVRAYAFEPVPQNIAILTENLTLNSLPDSRVRIFPFALSDTAGTTEIYFSQIQPGNSSLESSSSNEANRINADLRRGDELLKDLAPHLVIKLDIEGHEQQALNGLSRILSESKRCWLCIEDIFDRDDLYSYLEKRGFRFVAKLTPYNSWWRLG